MLVDKLSMIEYEKFTIYTIVYMKPHKLTSHLIPSNRILNEKPRPIIIHLCGTVDFVITVLD